MRCGCDGLPEILAGDQRRRRPRNPGPPPEAELQNFRASEVQSSTPEPPLTPEPGHRNVVSRNPSPRPSLSQRKRFKDSPHIDPAPLLSSSRSEVALVVSRGRRRQTRKRGIMRALYWQVGLRSTLSAEGRLRPIPHPPHLFVWHWLHLLPFLQLGLLMQLASSALNRPPSKLSFELAHCRSLMYAPREGRAVSPPSVRGFPCLATQRLGPQTCSASGGDGCSPVA